MRELGLRLRKLREEHLLTQEELGQKVRLSSEFISSIERGMRTPSLDSLIKIADFFKVGTSFFLNEGTDVFSRLEKELEGNKPLKKEIRVFKKYCEDYLKIEDMSGHRLEPAPVYQHRSPSELAGDERRRLGLVNAPLRDIFTLVEMNGLRVFRQAVEPLVKLAGVFIHFESENASFAMINSNQKLGLQVTAAAHLYGHYLKDRYEGPIVDNSDIFVDEYLSLYPQREQFACLFASNFLMPEEKIRSVIQKEQISGEIKYEQVVFLKRYFGVNTDIMLRHLSRLGILSFSTFMKYQEINTIKFEESLFGDSAGAEEFPSKADEKIHSSDRYKSLAVSVIQAETKNSKTPQVR
jgi:transcriptional regulator with XRE-family HTH domain